jgi:uncharacterized protein (TIGR02270 family)
MVLARRRSIQPVLEQHASAATALGHTRLTFVNAAHVKLRHLRRLDERLAAQLDGLLVAADDGWLAVSSGLEQASGGSMLIAAMLAVSEGRLDRLQLVLALAGALPQKRPEVLCACGWLEPAQLRGVAASLLRAADPVSRLVGAAACAMHRVDPGLTSARLLQDDDRAVRARAWRAAGELGKRELVSTAAATAVQERDPECRFWAAWTSVLLGDRQAGLEVLAQIAATSGAFRRRAFQLALQATTPNGGYALLQSLAEIPENGRRVIRGIGFVGDPSYCAWLVGQMTDESVARLAGEAFSLITGVDLAARDLERKPPAAFESGPNDDPNDSNVDVDEDDGLPWPDQGRVDSWWRANSNRFQPGVRYFMGEPVNRANCLRVLKEGYQRQRMAAALHLALIDPGTPLFEWRAPAWRQQRLLAGMT